MALIAEGLYRFVLLFVVVFGAVSGVDPEFVMSTGWAWMLVGLLVVGGLAAFVASVAEVGEP